MCTNLEELLYIYKLYENIFSQIYKNVQFKTNLDINNIIFIIN